MLVAVLGVKHTLDDVQPRPHANPSVDLSDVEVVTEPASDGRTHEVDVVVAGHHLDDDAALDAAAQAGDHMSVGRDDRVEPGHGRCFTRVGRVKHLEHVAEQHQAGRWARAVGNVLEELGCGASRAAAARDCVQVDVAEEDPALVRPPRLPRGAGGHVSSSTIRGASSSSDTTTTRISARPNDGPRYLVAAHRGDLPGEQHQHARDEHTELEEDHRPTPAPWATAPPAVMAASTAAHNGHDQTMR